MQTAGSRHDHSNFWWDYIIALVAQSCLTLCNPIDCSLPHSSVHGILQAKILEWEAITFSRGSWWPRAWTRSPAVQAGCLPSEPPGRFYWGDVRNNSSQCYSSIETSILSRVKQTTSPGWMHEIGAQGWCTGKTQRDGIGREAGGGIGMGNTCKSMADSCQCIAKTTTIL